MEFTIQAIYEQGILRPLQPLVLPEATAVQLTVRTGEAATSCQPVTPADWKGFERELKELLFEAPPLPHDFSRADIYDFEVDRNR